MWIFVHIMSQLPDIFTHSKMHVCMCFQHNFIGRYLNLILVNKFAWPISTHFHLLNTRDCLNRLAKPIKYLFPPKDELLKLITCACFPPHPHPCTIHVNPANLKPLRMLKWFLGCHRWRWHIMSEKILPTSRIQDTIIFSRTRNDTASPECQFSSWL